MTEKKEPEILDLESKVETHEIVLADLLSAVSLICRGVETSDDKLIGRALRIAFRKRPRFSEELLFDLFDYVIKSPSERTQLLEYFNNEMDTSEDNDSKKEERKKVVIEGELPYEVSLFVSTLISVFLIDQKRYGQAQKLLDSIISNIPPNNSVTSNQLTAKAFFYYSRAHELNKNFHVIRPVLFKALRRATLRRNPIGQNMLLNLLLRNLMSCDLYNQADKLIAQTETDFRSNAQESRFNYYKGRILAIQLDYGGAKDCLTLALRKSPMIAKGFRLVVQKLIIIVTLLMGDIPERNTFTGKLAYHLKPYLEMTNQVRKGDLNAFMRVLEKYKELFVKDKNLSLAQRIRKNVVRAGLHKISLSYDKISFVQICEKLNYDKVEDMECIVAKAIKDGILNATINSEEGFMEINKNKDVYSTLEPANELNERIRFCVNVHNRAVKAMSFPNEEKKNKILEDDEKRKKELKKRKREEEEKKKEEETKKLREQLKKKKE